MLRLGGSRGLQLSPGTIDPKLAEILAPFLKMMGAEEQINDPLMIKRFLELLLGGGRL